MKHSRVAVLVLAAVSLLAILAIASCSKSGSGYNAPTGPGGGTVTKELDSAALALNGVYSHTFNTAGSFPYHCSIHTSMRDTIFVNASAVATSGAIDISGFQFTPKHTTVKPGSVVTWTQKDSGTNHTVTSD